MGLTIQDLMSRTPHTIGVSLTLADASKLMKQYGIRHLPVLERGALVGLLSERDVQMIESLSALDPEDISVEEAMSQAPWTVAPSTPLEEVARHMAESKVGSAVVMDNERVVGVFTTTDGMRALADLLAESTHKLRRGA